MPRYFFVQHECDGTVTDDPVGVEAADLAEARAVALRRARAKMSDEVTQGRLCLSCWIVINDDKGHYLATLQFGEAVEMQRDHCSAPKAGEAG